MKSDLFSFADTEDQIKLVGFFVGEVRYGIDIMQVVEITNPGKFVQVPALPGHVVGMTDHRGVVIPILDLRLRLGLPGAPVSKRTKWILTKARGREFGLQVDRVTNVLKLSSSQKRERPQLDTDEQGAWICDVFADDEGLVFQMDLDAVTSGASVRAETGDPGDERP